MHFRWVITVNFRILLIFGNIKFLDYVHNARTNIIKTGLISIIKSIVNFPTWYLLLLPAGVHSSNLRSVPSNSVCLPSCASIPAVAFYLVFFIDLAEIFRILVWFEKLCFTSAARFSRFTTAAGCVASSGQIISNYALRGQA